VGSGIAAGWVGWDFRRKPRFRYDRTRRQESEMLRSA